MNRRWVLMLALAWVGCSTPSTSDDAGTNGDAGATDGAVELHDGGGTTAALTAPLLETPTIVSANQVDLSFSGGHGYTTLTAQRALAGTSNWVDLPVVTSSPIHVTGLSAATAYDFRLKASTSTDEAFSNVVSATTPAEAAWQLAEGHFVARKRDLVIIHPRPDSETGTGAQHRNAYPGVAWSTRIVVLNGAWPFKYELDAASVERGMSIGQLTSTSDTLTADPKIYGVLSWPNPVAGTYSVTVSVYDQEYGRGAHPSNKASVTFSLTVDPAPFVFVDAVHGDDTNPGTKEAPFKSIYKLHGGSSSTTTYQNKIVYLREGTIPLDGMKLTNPNNYRINGNQPKVFVGYPGETAVLQLYEGWVVIGENSSDFMVKDLTVSHAPTAFKTDQRFFFGSMQSAKRHSFHGVVFKDYKLGLGSGGENPSVLMYSGIGHQYVSMVGCEFTGTMGNALTTYNVSQSVIELNDVHDANFTGQTNPSNGHAIWYLKDTPSNITVRANQAWRNNTYADMDACFSLGSQNAQNPNVPYYEQIEVAFNTFDHPSNSPRVGVLSMYTFSGNTPTAAGAAWVYRNSLRRHVAQDIGPWPSVEYWGFNALDIGTGMPAAGTGTNPSGGTVTSEGNLQGTAGLLDATMRLSGAARTTSLGVVGAELH